MIIRIQNVPSSVRNVTHDRLYLERYTTDVLDRVYKNLARFEKSAKRLGVVDYRMEVDCVNHGHTPIYLPRTVSKLLRLKKDVSVLETWSFEIHVEFGMQKSQAAAQKVRDILLSGVFAQLGVAMSSFIIPKEVIPFVSDVCDLVDQEAYSQKLREDRDGSDHPWEYDEYCEGEAPEDSEESDDEEESEDSEESDDEEEEPENEVSLRDLDVFAPVRWESEFSPMDAMFDSSFRRTGARRGGSAYESWQDFVNKPYVKSVPCPLRGRWCGVSVVE